MECIIETKASTILQFFQGLNGSLQVTFEEGTWAAWLYDLLKPHVTELVVCNPRKNALLKEGSKSDRIDARKLAELLRQGSLSAVYHGEHGLRMLKELSRSYLTISKDLGRVMNRLKGLIFLLQPDVQCLLIRKVKQALNSNGQFLFTSPKEKCIWQDILTPPGVLLVRCAVLPRGLAS